MERYIKSYINDGIKLAEILYTEKAPEISKIAKTICACLKKGKKLMICGNGGSAADAQHIAAELVNNVHVFGQHR